MDDPQMQRAIYASIQSARAQGYHVGGSQTLRSTSHPHRGGAGSGNTTAARQAQQGANRSQLRYSGNSLPGMGTASAAAAAAAAGVTRSMRSSFGHIDALRRDGIAPAAASGAGAGVAPSSAAADRSAPTPGPPSPSPSWARGLPKAVPPRAPPSPACVHAPQHRTVASQPPRSGPAGRQHQQQRQQKSQQLGAQSPQQRYTPQRQHLLWPPAQQAKANPALEAIAAATAEAYSAFEGAAAATGGVSAAAPPAPSVPVNLATPSANTVGGSGGGTAGGGCSGNAPPPRALVAVQAAGGRVVMIPEGVEPGLAAAVLRDAVTWDTGVTFDDIAGCDRAKQLLHEAVALPLIIPEFFTGIREPWRGVLLHGPPGTGKTMLAKAAARMVGGAFFAVSPASLTSKWRGESEKLLAALFAIAQAHAPSIVFIDEVDALGGARGGDGEHEASRRFKAELLQQMDGLSSGRDVMVLAATNCPWDLDPALRRRLEKRIHIGLPDGPQRLALLQLHLRGVALAADVDLEALAASCEGFSGADIRLLCRDAAMAPLRRQLGSLPPPSGTAPERHPAQQEPASSLSASSSCFPSSVTGPQGPAASPPAPSTSSAAPPQPHQHQDQQSQLQPQQQQPQQLQQPAVLLRSAADIRRLADSGELARGAVVCAADLAAARGSVRPSVSAQQAARYEAWDREFAST